MTSTVARKKLSASSTDLHAANTSSAKETGDAVHTIVSGRKCWRIMKGKDEAVWPPALEAALIEGLEKYKPSESRSTRSLGRFPMRNKFISDHILEKTGKHRTPKQVGSRIQQLRDTSSGKHILKVYSDRHYEMMRPSRPAVAAEDQRELSPASTQSDSYSSSPSPAPQSNHISIEVLPPYTPQLSQFLSPPSFLSRSAAAVNAVDDFRALGPRPLRNIDPTVTFTSPSPISCYSSFHVMKDGVLVHSEVTAVEACQPKASGSSTPAFMYRTTLVPQLWSQLCQSDEPEAYTIGQEIITTPDAGNSSVLSSITYHFINAAAVSRAFSPNPSIDGSVHSDTLSSVIRTPDLGSDFGDFIYGQPSVDNMLTHPQLGTVDDSLLPDLLHHGDDGYASFPSSPSEVSAMVDVAPWPNFGADIQAQTVIPDCDGYFSTMAHFPPASCFDDNAISDMFF